MKPRYDLAYHVERLEKMLQKEGACSCCPAYQHFDIERDPLAVASEYSSRWQSNRVRKEICTMCRKFVGLESSSGCPCKVLGAEKAIKLTEKAIDNYHLARRG